MGGSGERLQDARWMRKALALAAKGMGTASPNPMVGAIIVRDGKVLGQGWHVRPGEGHAEVNAIRDAGGEAPGAAIYVTLEPCSTWGRTPPCTDAILKAGIKRVVAGCLDPNPKHAGAGMKILADAGIETVCGVEEESCQHLNEAFFKWICAKRPFVLLKMAETLDGKIATASGKSQWITGAAARRRVQKLRLWADAIIVGSSTAELDKPRLTVRTGAGRVVKTPRRFVASSRGAEALKGLEGVWECVKLAGKPDWDAFLAKLGAEGATSLLIEGGGELAASALAAGAVDKVEFHIAPKILGGRGSRSSVGGANPESLAEAFSLSDVSLRKLGCDIALSGYIKRTNNEAGDAGCSPDLSKQ